MKKILIAILTVFSVFSLTACNDKEPVVEEEVLSVAAQSFVDSVKLIGDVTLDSEDSINDALTSYEALASDDLVLQTVIDFKLLLDSKEEYFILIDEINDENKELKTKEELINRFIIAVSNLPDASVVTEADYNSILSAQFIYNDIVSKYSVEDEVLVEAHNVLTKINDAYNVVSAPTNLKVFTDLIAMFAEDMTHFDFGEDLVEYASSAEVLKLNYDNLSAEVKSLDTYAQAEEDYIVVMKSYSDMLEGVNLTYFNMYMKDLAVISLYSNLSITEATRYYDLLNDETKGTDEIKALKLTLDSAIAEYNILYEADQPARVTLFKSLVQSLPTSETVGVSDYTNLLNIQELYETLSDVSKADSEVTSGYNTLVSLLNTIMAAGYGRLNTYTPALTTSGVNPSITISNSYDLFSTMLPGNFADYNGENYTSFLASKGIDLVLYVHLDGQTTYSAAITVDYNDLIGNSAIMYDTIIRYLKTEAETNSAIKTGLYYSFSINFVDSNAKLLSSASSNLTIPSNGFKW